MNSGLVFQIRPITEFSIHLGGKMSGKPITYFMTGWSKKLVGPDIDLESKNSSLLSLTKYLQSFQAQNNILGEIAMISTTYIHVARQGVNMLEKWKWIKFFHAKQFWIVLWSSTPVATFIFPAASIWSPTAASKLGAVKSTLLNKSCSNQKILADLLYHF